VFQDVAAINPGEDFTVELDRALSRSDAVLSLIGPTWIATSGVERLKSEHDFVRLELARALSKEIPVVPVLVGGARLPASDELPEDLRPLAHRQAVVLRDATWPRDVDGLIRGLQGKHDKTPSRNRRRLLIVALFAVPLLALGTWQLTASDSGNGGNASNNPSESAPPQCETPGADWNNLVLGDHPNSGVTNASKSSQLIFGVESGAWREVRPGAWRVVVHTTMKNATNTSQYDGDWLYGPLIVGGRTFAPTCFGADPKVVASQTVGDAFVGFDVRCPPNGHIELGVGQRNVRIDVTSRDLPASEC
jgi:hypothetical protein